MISGSGRGRYRRRRRGGRISARVIVSMAVPMALGLALGMVLALSGGTPVTTIDQSAQSPNQSASPSPQSAGTALPGQWPSVPSGGQGSPWWQVP
jgi:hypothetical protein